MPHLSTILAGSSSNLTKRHLIPAYLESTPFDEDRAYETPVSGVITVVSADSSTGDAQIEGSTNWPLTGLGTWHAYVYVHIQIIPTLLNQKVKIGFSGLLSYKLESFWQGSGSIDISVVLLSAAETELDSHLIWADSVYDSEASGTPVWSSSTTYKLDGEFTLQYGQTYYLAVRLHVVLDNNGGIHSATGVDPAYLDVSAIRYYFYT